MFGSICATVWNTGENYSFDIVVSTWLSYNESEAVVNNTVLRTSLFCKKYTEQLVLNNCTVYKCTLFNAGTNSVTCEKPYTTKTPARYDVVGKNVWIENIL